MKKTRIEGYTEKVELKMLDCKSCGAGYVLYDSRDRKRIASLPSNEREVYYFNVATHSKLENQPCHCGKGTFVLSHDKWEKYHKGYTIVTCDCGSKVECHDFTNTCCTCGADYNLTGTRLAPREFWENDDADDERWKTF